MKSFLALFAAGWFLTLFLPWWGLVLPGVVLGAWLSPDVRTALLAGAAGGASAWMAQALLSTLLNGGLLAGRVSMILFGAESSVLLVLLTGAVGGLLGGSSMLTGFQIRQVLRRD